MEADNQILHILCAVFIYSAPRRTVIFPLSAVQPACVYVCWRKEEGGGGDMFSRCWNIKGEDRALLLRKTRTTRQNGGAGDPPANLKLKKKMFAGSMPTLKT